MTIPFFGSGCSDPSPAFMLVCRCYFAPESRLDIVSMVSSFVRRFISKLLLLGLAAGMKGAFREKIHEDPASLPGKSPKKKQDAS